MNKPTRLITKQAGEARGVSSVVSGPILISGNDNVQLVVVSYRCGYSAKQ